MSVKSKGVTIEKIEALFNKADLDDQINLFKQLKESLTKKVLDRAKEHEGKQNELLSIAESLNN